MEKIREIQEEKGELQLIRDMPYDKTPAASSGQLQYGSSFFDKGGALIYELL